MQLTDKQWKALIRDLQQQRCILLLGSHVAASPGPEGKPERISVLLARHLAGILDAEHVSYEPEQVENLLYIAQRFLSIPKTRRIDLEDEVCDFYQTHLSNVPEFHARLARLPFNIVVNLSPDNYFYRALRAAGKTSAQWAHYNFRKERPLNILPPDAGRPLVYNLLGSIDDPESLVLTQEDRVDFIKNVVKGNPDIPNAVMSHFDERKTYVFLGFNLENWDYRLLFEALKLSKENMSFLPQPGSIPVSPEARSYFEDRYRVMFIDTRMEAFVNELEQHYSDAVQNAPTVSAGIKRVVILSSRRESDTQFVQSLCTHLSRWGNRGILEIWHPDMPLGVDIDKETLLKIAAADAVLPVLSADFWADDNLVSSLLPQLLLQRRSRGMHIFPILFRACDYEDSELSVFPILPLGGRPFRNWPDEDEAFKNIVDNLKSMLYE